MTSYLFTMQRYDNFRYHAIFFDIKVRNCVRKRLRTHHAQAIDLQQPCDCLRYTCPWAIP